MKRARGFTYVALLIAIAVFGVASVGFATYWSEFDRAEREKELLRIGHEFVRAIRGYYESSPGTVRRYPRSLEDLLEDRRFVGIRRHLRRIYVDPMTGVPTWGVVRAPDGGVMGVFSLSEMQPKKRANFPAWVDATVAAATYRDWRYVYVPPADKK
jgi:type II secretory pathway pseudopilin PulG